MDSKVALNLLIFVLMDLIHLNNIIQRFLYRIGLFIQTCNKLNFTNLIESSIPKNYEDVNSIREFAPSNFRIGRKISD